MSVAKPSVQEWQSFSVVREEEVTLTRRLIGHSRLTHCDLLRDEPAAACGNCDCQLAVEHILVDSLCWAEARCICHLHGAVSDVIGDDPSNGDRHVVSEL
jgi:hypothetical protein